MAGIMDEWLKNPLVRYYLYGCKKRGHKELERNKEIRELHKNGMSLSEIGRKYGISRQRVFQIVKK